MGDVKLHLEAESLKDIMEDIIASIEGMGAVVVKATDDPPEALEKMLAGKGMFLFKPGNPIPDGLLPALAANDQEDMIDFLLKNPDGRQRIVQRLEEMGFDIKPPEKDKD